MADETAEAAPAPLRVEVLPDFGFRVSGHLDPLEAAFLACFAQASIIEAVALAGAPRVAQRTLCVVWRILKDHIAGLENLPPPVQAAANVVAEYFAHAGDWPRIVGCLRKAAGEFERGALLLRTAQECTDRWAQLKRAAGWFEQQERELAAQERR